MPRPTYRRLRPSILVWFAVALAILLGTYTVVALRQSRGALERSVHRSAEALAGSLSLAVRNLTNAGNLIDELWFARWQDAAMSMSAQRPAARIPGRWLFDFEASRIDWADLDGRILSSTDAGAGDYLPVTLLTDSSWSALRDGALYAEFDRAVGSSAAVVRADTCALVIWGAAGRLSSLQVNVGAGFLLRSISEIPSLEYVVLQELDGIVMASRRVEEMSRIADDSLLTALLASPDGVASRDWRFADLAIIEAVAKVPDQPRILRVGFSRESLRRLDYAITLQLSVLAGLIFLVGLGGLAVLWTSQRYTLAVEDLTAAEALTDELFRGIRSALIVIDRDGKIRLANPQAGSLLGQPSNALVGKSYPEVAPGDPALFAPLQEAGRATLEREIVWLNPAGDERILLVSTTRLRGQRDDAVAILHDVTDARRLARQAEQNERLAAMGDLAAGVAHEIRNPLNAISIAAQRLRAEFTPSEAADEYRDLLGNLTAEIGRLNETVQQFLSLARGLNLERHEVEMATLLESVASGLRLEATEKGVTFETQIATLETVMGDAEALRKVVVNLGQNALAATPRGGTVKLAAVDTDGAVRFTVTDTGLGIDPADLPQLFRPYFTRKKLGSGIGLALVHRIVTEHGGTIEVASKPGEGSAFTVTLPAQATGRPA